MAGGFTTISLIYEDPFRAASNVPGLNMVRFLKTNNREIASRQVRMGTGVRTIRPEDGAAFYAISKKAEMQVRAKEVAIDNIGDAKDLLGLAETGLLNIDLLLERMRDIVVRAANDTLSSEQREDIAKELEQLAEAIDEIASRTRFNETDLMFDGNFEQTYQIGPSAFGVDELTVKLGNFFAEALGVDPDSISVASHEEAQAAITTIDNAVGQVKDQLIRLGGIQSELTRLEDVLSGSIPPEASIQSLYGDADIAQEQVALTKLNLFNQIATAQAAATGPLQASVFSMLA